MRRRGARGFTLIELMVAMVIVGIIAAIALPTYKDHIRKTHRANAKAMMVETAQFMERFHTANNTYAGAEVIAEHEPKGSSGAAQRYQLAFTGTQDQTVYKLEATPLNDQLGDKCGTLTLTSTGVQGAATSGCW